MQSSKIKVNDSSRTTTFKSFKKKKKIATLNAILEKENLQTSTRRIIRHASLIKLSHNFLSLFQYTPLENTNSPKSYERFPMQRVEEKARKESGKGGSMKALILRPSFEERLEK